MFVAIAVPPTVVVPVASDVAGVASAGQKVVVGIWFVSVK